MTDARAAGGLGIGIPQVQASAGEMPMCLVQGGEEASAVATGRGNGRRSRLKELVCSWKS